MALNYKKILERKQTYDDYFMHFFDALETVKNTKVNSFIENERRAYETNRCASNYVPKDLMRAVREVYNNLVDQGAYDQTKEGKRTQMTKDKPESSKLLVVV